MGLKERQKWGRLPGREGATETEVTTENRGQKTETGEPTDSQELC